ncbi:MAG: peptidylprolyl isomerase [Oligoflexales bacterium]
MYRWKGKQLDKVDTKKISSNWVTYAILIIAVGAMTFFGVCDPGSRMMSGPTGVAAYVGSDEVSNLQFRRTYQSAYERYRSQFSGNFDPAMIQLSKSVVGQLVNDLVVYNEAVESGVFSSTDEVEKTISEAELFHDEKGNFSTEKFDQFLRSNRYTEESFTEEVRRNLTQNKFRQFVTETYQISDQQAEWLYKLDESKMDVEFLKVTPADVTVSVSNDEIAKFMKDEAKQIDEYYEKNKAEFDTDKKVNAQHILVAFQGARNAPASAATRTKEDAKQIATKILGELKANKDFAALVAQYSDDPSAKTNKGNLGFFARDAMVKPFSDAAFSLQKGQLSGVVESDFGFHIIKVLDVREARKIDLNTAKKEIAQKLLEKQKHPKALEETTNNLLAALQKSDNSNVLVNQFASKWEKTGPFALNASSVPKLGSDADVRSAVLSMGKSPKLYEKVVTVGPDRVIMRLASFQEADMSKLDAKKKDDIKKSESFNQAYGVFNAVVTEAKQKLEKNNKIWINEEYENWDINQKAQQQPADAGT